MRKSDVATSLGAARPPTTASLLPAIAAVALTAFAWPTLVAPAVRGLATAVASAPAVAPAASVHIPAAADPHSAARARALSTGEPVTVDALTTADSLTVANPDGSFTQTTSALPIRMKSASGAWEDIDPTLRRSANGSIVTGATPDALALSGGGTGPLVTFDDRAGHVLSLSLPVRLPRPSLSGASATYRGVYRGVDLVVTAQPSGGFGEVFVVHDAAAAAAASLRFTTSLRGLALKADESGELAAVDPATGQVVLTAPPAALWDSAGAGSDASGPGPRANAARLPVAVDGEGLTLEAGAASLDPDAATYPLYLDPTWTPPSSSAGRSNYEELQQSCGNASQTAQPGVGYNDFNSCIGAYRSFFAFNVSGLHTNFQVLNTTLKIDEVFSALNSCGEGSETITIRWVNPLPSSFNWSSQPGAKSGVTNPITSQSLKSVGNPVGTMCSGGTVPADFDMKSAIDEVVSAGNITTLTIGMYGNETAGSNSLERFNNNPSILTQYDIKPNQPSNLAASPTPIDSSGAADQGCGSAAAGYLGISNLGGRHVATLSATVTSPIAAAQMAGHFPITDDTANKMIAKPASSGFVTTGASVSVNTPALTDGHEYSWSLYANDQFLNSPSSTTCKFLVDETAPFNPTIKSPDFPPVGSGQPSGRTNGQVGALTLTSSDPNPSRGHGSGMRGFRWSLDTPIPSSGASTTGSSGTLSVSVTPAQWGVHTLYAEAIDKAGNVSAQAQYSFYVPWNPATRITAGDVSGDGIPDLVTTTSSGNLVEYQGNADPDSPAVTLSTPQFSPDAQGTPWNRYLLTHRGSFVNQGVDDVWAYNTVNHALYLYRNVGTIPFENTANVVTGITKAAVASDAFNISPTSPDSPTTACATTSTGSCAGYDDTDWSTVTQVLAAGDLYAGTPVAAFDKGAPGLLTVEGGSLWYYQGQTTALYLGTAIQLGTSGWNGVTLIAPGTVAGRPALWARDNATGTIYQYTITFDSAGFPVSLGTPSSGTALTIPNSVTFQRSLYPAIASPGDLRASGNPDLVATTTSGKLIDYPGAQPTSAGVAQLGSPVTLGAQSGIVHDWPLTDGSGSTAADTASGTSATLSSGASWATDATRGTVVALNGSSGYLALPQQMISGTSTLTLTVTFKANSGTTGILFSTGHDVPANVATGAMPVLYIGTDGKLYGQYWNGKVQPTISPHPVNDGAWHTATLVGAATIQSLYLDSHFIRSQRGTLANLEPLDFAGAGVFNTTAWVNAPGGHSTAHASYFTGDLSEIRFSASAQPPTATAQIDAGQAPALAGPSLDQPALFALGLTQNGVGGIDFSSDGTVYTDGSVFTSPKTTLSFDQGGLTLSDSTTGQVIETYGNSGYPDATLVLQTDGNLVVYDTDATPLWALQADENAVYSSGDVMELLANGNLVIYSSLGGVIWQATSRANPGALVLVDEGMCVDDANGAAASGNKVQVWSCLGNSNQTWLVGSDGTIRFNANQSYCMEVSGSATASGTPVDLGACNGGANQQWTTQASGAIVNPNSGRCLDDTNLSTNNGTPLQISDCLGNPDQMWEIPGI
jgi:Ricin-type beta-trefoil lectin domain